MRRLYLRKGEITGEIMVCVVVNGNGLHHEAELTRMLKEALPTLASVVIKLQQGAHQCGVGEEMPHRLWFKYHQDQLCGAEIPCFPSLLFYQVNRGPKRNGFTCRRQNMRPSPAPRHFWTFTAEPEQSGFPQRTAFKS